MSLKEKTADLHINQFNALHNEIRDNLNHSKMLQHFLFVSFGSLSAWILSTFKKDGAFILPELLSLPWIVGFATAILLTYVFCRYILNRINIETISLHIKEIETAFKDLDDATANFPDGWELSKDSYLSDAKKQVKEDMMEGKIIVATILGVLSVTYALVYPFIK